MSRATWFRQRARAGETEKAAEFRETVIAAEGETATPLRLIESRLGPGRCAQCNGERDDKEHEHIIHGARVLLHRECVRFYRAGAPP